MIVIDMNGIQMTIEDAEKFIRWLEQPEGKLLREFLSSQREQFEAHADAAIGANAITDILNRERNIASKLAMDSVLKLHDDIQAIIIDEKDR